jgi:predicted Zn-dependent protease
MRRPVIFACCVVLAACATIEKGERAAANVLVPPKDEIAIGKEMKKELAKEMKLHPDAGVQRYITTMGNKMAKRVKSPVPLHFHVVDDDKQVNAFAIPGGDIYVFTGLLKLADDDSEVACVLGHEISHVTQRHVAQRLVEQVGLQTALGMALGKSSGALKQLAASAAANGALLKFSRDDERDADEHGLPLCSAAGYDPKGFIRMFKKIKGLGGSPEILAMLQTHPLPQERIENAQKEVAQLKHKGDDKNEGRYEDFKRDL